MPRSGPCEYTPASSRPTCPYTRPRGTNRRLVGRGEEHGVLVATRGRAAGGDAKWGQVNLDGDGTRLFCVASESGANERSASVQCAGDRNEDARGRTHGTVEELTLTNGSKRDGRVCDRFERLDLAPRDLENPPREGCHRGRADIHPDSESESERELAGRRGAGTAGDDGEQAERVDLGDPRQAERRDREVCHNTSCADRIVVGVERIQAQAPEAFVGR